ncbi:MAG: membrane dipeptidase [Hydrotalea flava]|uniref:dipeptidase n=1 Tax=Hydrotalea TaxID=1004300 RepID=UPI0010279A74|nr:MULTISPECIES: dipeptidase [Hydrotalea]MBY0348948.1 dipeptidase [Hydrotalea flava]NIM35350.1 membrane dipeptidase [Hydrotalea flava]NIM38209.1 membrane dipeptidase [Hydrotalea flava]NIN03373.1 membrane dipeptidase [Hydrotalea flava]NIN15067.1 membrane dipeptidase [Hydrotalea flava]
MKIFFTLIALCFAISLSAQRYQRITQQAILVDTHNDILTACIEKKVSLDQDLKGITMSDLKRFKQGGVDVQFFSVWCDSDQRNPFDFANREMDTLYAVAERNPDKMAIVKNYSQLMQAVKAHKLAALFGVEGGHMIENDVSKLDSLYKRGARYLTLTWNNSNPWASSAMDETLHPDALQQKGLSDFGKKLVQHMNQLGMMIDVSHVGEQTFWDVMHATTKPVIASHSDVYALCPVFRNLKDDQIKAIGKNGGVVQLNFYSGFLDSTFMQKQKLFGVHHRHELDSMIHAGTQQDYALIILFEKYAAEVNSWRPPLSLLLDHLDYVVHLIGVDHVGIGSDFDGINAAPQQLNDVTNYALITKGLLQRGYSKKDINKILGGNLLRVFKQNEN